MPTYFDELTLGQTIVTQRRTITEADVVMFAGLTGDYNPLHTDEVFAQNTLFGTRIAHGLLGFAISAGLVNQTGIFAGSVIALLGYKDWKFTGPIRFGDTIHVEMEVANLKPSDSKPQGVVQWVRRVVNQDGDVVQQGTSAVLMRNVPTDVR